MNEFDEDGRYENGDGVLKAVFLTMGGRKMPGRLCFDKGRCVRGEADGFTAWELLENAPLMQMHFLLCFEGEKPDGILITDGRVVQQYDQGVRKG